MYCSAEDLNNSIKHLLENFEGLTKDQLSKLLAFYKDDDWGFVIKCNSLVEACLTDYIRSILGKPCLDKVIASLPLGDTSYGKIEFVKALSPEKFTQHSDFAKQLSKLRNKLAHRVDLIDFDLQTYYASLDTNQKRNLSVPIAHLLGTKLPQGSTWLNTSAKPMILLAMLRFVIDFTIDGQTCSSRVELMKSMEKTTANYIAELKELTQLQAELIDAFNIERN